MSAFTTHKLKSYTFTASQAKVAVETLLGPGARLVGVVAFSDTNLSDEATITFRATSTTHELTLGEVTAIDGDEGPKAITFGDNSPGVLDIATPANKSVLPFRMPAKWTDTNTGETYDLTLQVTIAGALSKVLLLYTGTDIDQREADATE